MNLQGKHLLIAGALALEWGLAFAFARKFAYALADANAKFADDSLERRIEKLELWHGVDDGERWPTRLQHARVSLTDDDLDREVPTGLD